MMQSRLFESEDTLTLPTRPSRPQRGRVHSVERAISLLEALSEDDKGLRLSDLATRTSLSPSTVHRLMTTLEGRSFVQFDQLRGLWHVGRQAFAVGATFEHRGNFGALALPFMRRLRDQTHETANLGVINQDEMVVLRQIESREIVQTVAAVGGRAPIMSTGMGKAILATYSDEGVTALLARRGMRRLTRNTIVDPGQLRQELQTIRLQGYAVDDEECAPGLKCIAAAVCNGEGEAVYAISISSLPIRLNKERIPMLGRLVAETAKKLTETLGGVFSPKQ